MKLMKLQQVIEILKDSSAVMWDHPEGNDFLFCYPIVRHGREFLTLNSFDYRGCEFIAEFLEEDNQEVKVVEESMFLIDSNKNKVRVDTLFPQILEEPPLGFVTSVVKVNGIPKISITKK